MPHNLAIVGLSTGGPGMLPPLFTGMPVLNGSIIVVLHMPPFINAGIVNAIGTYCPMRSKLAENGERLCPGTIYVAPSNLHLTLTSHNQGIILSAGERINFVCPSIDVTMQSVCTAPHSIIAGAILTGMGHDGAQGIVHLKSIGAVTMAQNEETSVIFSMPRTAIETGSVDHILAPENMQEKLIKLFGPL